MIQQTILSGALKTVDGLTVLEKESLARGRASALADRRSSSSPPPRGRSG
ncbi:MAG: hypothetical protein R2748_29925 [Bryobacterales bacterium]